MRTGKLITLTGTDRIGKETQSFLLKQAMLKSRIDVRGMSFPEYGKHWAAEFVRATLDETFITVQRDGQPPMQIFPKKNPYIFQMWQSADRIDRQPWIEETLAAGVNIIADRYEIDAYAYGKVDGCNSIWLQAMNGLYRPSDQVIVLVGEPFPRPGEKPDLNERDEGFQRRVRRAYESLCDERPETRSLLGVDAFRCADVIESKRRVHEAICGRIERCLGLTIRALEHGEITRIEAERLGG